MEMTNMLFHEIYGTYFQVVADILTEAEGFFCTMGNCGDLLSDINTTAVAGTATITLKRSAGWAGRKCPIPAVVSWGPGPLTCI